MNICITNSSEYYLFFPSSLIETKLIPDFASKVFFNLNYLDQLLRIDGMPKQRFILLLE